MSDHWWLYEAWTSPYDSVGGEGEGEDDGEGEGEDEYEPGTFRLEFRTRADQTITIRGHRRVFSDPGRMATEIEIRQIAEQIVYALNAATGRLE